MADDPGGVQALLAKLRDLQDRPPEPAPQSAPRAYSRPWALASRPAAAPAPAHLHRAPPEPARPPVASASLDDLPFDDALARVAHLARDKSFGRAIRQLQAEQDELERTLDAERRAMIGPHGEHLHGTKYVYGLLTRSGARCQATYARWMWDALRRWDQLRYAQQQRLERLGVPYFFETNERDALAKQQRLLPHLLQHAAPTTS